jgi:hypothetical protein
MSQIYEPTTAIFSHYLWTNIGRKNALIRKKPPHKLKKIAQLYPMSIKDKTA